MDRDTLLDGLSDAGLSTYQADAYVTLLEQGVSPAVDVARHCSIPGPRIYDVLKELEQMGYVETLDRETLHARACDPVELIEDLQDTSERLADVAGEIGPRRNPTGRRPRNARTLSIRCWIPSTSNSRRTSTGTPPSSTPST